MQSWRCAYPAGSPAMQSADRNRKLHVSLAEAASLGPSQLDANEPPPLVPGKERRARGSERCQAAWQHVARPAPGLGTADTQGCFHLGGCWLRSQTHLPNTQLRLSRSASVRLADYSSVATMGSRCTSVSFGPGKSPGSPKSSAQIDRDRAGLYFLSRTTASRMRHRSFGVVTGC